MKHNYYRGMNDIDGNGWVVFSDDQTEKYYYGQYLPVCNLLKTKDKQFTTVKKDLKRMCTYYEAIGYERFTDDEIHQLTHTN